MEAMRKVSGQIDDLERRTRALRHALERLFRDGAPAPAPEDASMCRRILAVMSDGAEWTTEELGRALGAPALRDRKRHSMLVSLQRCIDRDQVERVDVGRYRKL